MNSVLAKKGFMLRFLVFMCIFGVSFSFAASGNGDIGAAVSSGFFEFIKKYLAPIVIGITILTAVGMAMAGIEWKFILVMTVVVIIGWVIASDKNLIEQVQSGTKSFVSSFL